MLFYLNRYINFVKNFKYVSFMSQKMKTNLEKYTNNDKSSLLDLLMSIQDREGFLSEDSIINVSNQLEMSATQIYGIASFYDQFKFKLNGKYHIKICNGLSCHLSESNSILKAIEKLLKIKEGQTTHDGKFSIESVNCLGGCSKAIVISINDEYYTEINQEKVIELINSFIQLEK